MDGDVGHPGPSLPAAVALQALLGRGVEEIAHDPRPGGAGGGDEGRSVGDPEVRIVDHERPAGGQLHVAV